MTDFIILVLAFGVIVFIINGVIEYAYKQESRNHTKSLKRNGWLKGLDDE